MSFFKLENASTSALFYGNHRRRGANWVGFLFIILKLTLNASLFIIALSVERVSQVFICNTFFEILFLILSIHGIFHEDFSESIPSFPVILAFAGPEKMDSTNANISSAVVEPFETKEFAPCSLAASRYSGKS